eukprot:gene14358-15852_t
MEISKQQGNLQVYPSSSVTVHVPYTGTHGQSSSSRSVIQTTGVIVQQPKQPQQSTSAHSGRAAAPQTYQSKYGELLNVIEDLGREIKPTYAGSKMAQERLKKGIMHARTLVRECLLEVDKSSRQ